MNLLVYRLGSLGDTIIVLPCFHLVRRAFPDARITLLANEPVSSKAPSIKSILAGSGLYNDAWAYTVNARNPRSLLDLASRIRSARFDAMVYLAKPKGDVTNILRDKLFFHFAGIPKIYGMPWKRANRLCLENPSSGLHEWDCMRAVRCLHELGTVDLDDPTNWDLRLLPEERADGQGLLAKLANRSFIALSVGTKAPAKDWEHANWLALCQKLAPEYPEHSFVFLGAPDESERSEALLRQIGGRGLNLCGVTTPRVAAAILEGADVFVGHDSGPMHLAACMGTPVVAIFAARNLPGEWYPRGGTIANRIHYRKTECYGCQLVDCITEKKRCILSITPDEVFASVNELVAARRTQRARP